MSTPIEDQKRAAYRTGYGAIALRRHGDYAVVEVEALDTQRSDGGTKWVEVIREHVDGNFSHIVEPRGIEVAIFGEAKERK